MSIIKRVAAISLAVILAGLYIATFVMAVTGSEYVMGMIFLDVVIPVLCWGVSLIARVLRRTGNDMANRDKDVEKK